MEALLTEDQRMMRAMVREFAEEKIRPIAADIDREHRFPLETVKQMAELGLMGMTIPEEYEGSGGDALSYIIAVEELARVCATHGVILSVHMSVCAYPIYQMGTEEQKQKYLPDLASGRKIGGFCLTEPGAGSDAAAQKTVAVKKGDKYIINGSKIFITNGGYADTFIVVALTDPAKGIHGGCSAFIVEKSFPGFEVGQTENKMGICASSTVELNFRDMEVPAENLIGGEGNGFKVAMKALDGGRISIAAQALGIAQGALEAAIAYSKERVQFGKPICKQQGIQWMLAEMATRTMAARGLVYRAANLKEIHAPYGDAGAMAKLFAGQNAVWVTNQALQIHGGIGYTKAFPVERYYRDAKITEIYEGTKEIQRLVIARNLLK